MISVDLVGERHLVAKLRAAPKSVRAKLLSTVTRLTLLLEARVKAKLTGPVSDAPASSPRIGFHGASCSSGFRNAMRKPSSIQVNLVSAPETRLQLSTIFEVVSSPGGVTALKLPCTRRSTTCGG